ncbi:MAG: hypothetical protein ACLS9K_14330 [Lachnospira eligens]
MQRCCINALWDTVVLSTATASKEPREGIDFFPLSVEYEEKSMQQERFLVDLTREKRHLENAILTSRVIDRPMRPLFPKDIVTMLLLITWLCQLMRIADQNYLL